MLLLLMDDAFPRKPTFEKTLLHQQSVGENVRKCVRDHGKWFFYSHIQPDEAEIVTPTACTLHNFLRRKKAGSQYTPQGAIDSETADTHELQSGNWRQGPRPGGLTDVAQQGGNHASATAEIKISFERFQLLRWTSESAIEQNLT